MSRRTPRRPTTIGEAAAHYGVSKRTVQRWIAAGILPAYKVGPYIVRVDLDDVEKLARPVRTA